MYKLSERCRRLRDDAVNAKPLNRQILAQRALLYEAGVYESINESRPVRIAAGLANIMRNARPIIQDGELIVGYNYADGNDLDSWRPRDPEEDLNRVLKSGFTGEQLKAYFDHHDEVGRALEYGGTGYGYRPNRHPRVAELCPFVKDFTQQELDLDVEWAAIGRCISDNHSAINFIDAVSLGFTGLKTKVEVFEKINGKNDMYEAMKVVCDAACALGENYAKKAGEMAEAETRPERKKELMQIAETCRRVPAYPARTFREAVQSFLFAHYISTWEDGINANSLGRLDHLFYPYYKRDIEEGILTREEAFELICCLWVKLYRDYDVQQSCVGGVKRDGSDGVNELSWMMLDATEEMNFIRCLSVRLNKNSDRAFIRRALEVVAHVQKGIPFFFNDDALIPSLTSAGIPLEDARDYVQVGCVETAIWGRSNPHAVSGETNLLKALEYVFGNGQSLFAPERKPGLETGTLDQFRTYEDFYAAVCRQMEHLIHVSCKKVMLWTKVSVNNPKPVKSLLTVGCIETGRDFNNAGAQYDYYQMMMAGIPNLADSLMAVKKLVYEDRRITLEELRDQMAQNFPDEALRQWCLRKAPKYGNDEDEVDRMAADIITFASERLKEQSEVYMMNFHIQPFSYHWMVDHGRVTAATPDGRKKGEIIAYSLSPMQGRDFNGLTALLNSLCKLPTTICPGTISAIVEVDPKLMSDDNLDVLTDVLRAAVDQKISNVQFNTIDADTLRDAQLHPEMHSNLAVRVSGYSKKFNLLDRTLQDHIIERTKHQCL